MNAPPVGNPLGYRFDDIILDIARCRVRRNEADLPFGRLSYELLVALVEAAPKTVTHEELAKRLWRGRYVTRNTTKQRIHLLREALSDSAHHPRYVCVVRGQGYRLIPDVEPLYADPAKLNDSQSENPAAHVTIVNARRRYVPLVLAIVGAFVATLWNWQHDGDEAPKNSIAVLPFTDLSEAGNQDNSSDDLDPLPIVDELDPEVRALYEQARYINQTVFIEGLPRARRLLADVIRLEPHYLPARLELLQTISHLLNNGWLSQSEATEAFTKAFSDIEAIWPDSPEVSLLRPMVAFAIDGEFEAAASYFEHALSDDPGDLTALWNAQYFALLLNRPATSAAIGEYVVEHDPICLYCYVRLMTAYIRIEEFEKVEEAYLAARSVGLDSVDLRYNYAFSLLLSGEVEAALAEFDGIPSPADFMRLSGSAMALHSLGREAEFTTALDELRQLEEPLAEAAVHAWIFDLDSAFEILDEIPNFAPWQMDGPMASRMRKHDRWDELAAKAGIWPEDPRIHIQFEIDLPD